jgi:hypothetical protein
MKARCIVLVVALGCSADDDEAMESESSTSETGTSTSTSTSTTSSSTSESTSAAETTSGGSTGVDDSGSSSGGAGTCDFEEVVCAAADQSKQEPIDCGFVLLTDDQATWQAAYDCFRDAFLDQMAAKLLWQNEAVDSTNYSAMVAQVGGAYQLLRFEYDDYMGDIMGSVTVCTGITEDPMCMPEVGQMCLQCMGPGEPMPICE